MWKFFTIFIFLFANQISTGQTGPILSIKKINKNNIITWTSSFTSVTGTNIQRSFDSTKNFKTIGTLADLKKTNNKYIDVHSPSQSVFYRLFISFKGGEYLYTTAVSSFDPTKNLVIENKTELPVKKLAVESEKVPIQTLPVANLKDTGSAKIIRLKDVKVIIKKPVIEQDVDKLTYHVEADPESKVMTALDMLRKVPMVTVDGEDNIQVNGSSNYQVLINGKVSSLFLRNPSDIFKGMPASIIKDIEVITNPSARYSAAGVGGIINVVTYKKNITGYNGSAVIALSSPKGFTATGYFSAKQGKINLSGYFGTTKTTNPQSTSYFLREDKVRHNTLKQTGESNSTSNNQNMGIEVNYELDSFNTIRTNVNINAGKSTNSFNQHAQMFNASSTIIEEYSYLNAGLNKWNSNDISLEYQKTFKNTGQQLTMSYSLNHNSGSGPSNILHSYSQRKNLESNTDNNNFNKENILQADFIYPIKKHAIEAGIKSSVGFNSSEYFYKNKDTATGVFLLDASQSDNFEYRQNIHSAYASVNLKKNNWGLKAGSRLEKTIINAAFKTTGTVARQNYFNIIPNILVSHKLKGTSTMRLSFTQRIERPALNYLNPYVYILDPKNISFGNTKLTAAVSNVFNLAYNTFVKGTSITANAFYNYTNNSIQQFTFLGTDTIARTTYGNIATGRTVGISASGNTIFFKKLTVNVNATSSFISFTSPFISKPRKGLVLSISGYSNYNFNKGWRASGNIGYSTKGVFLQGTSAGYLWNSLSLFKDILQDNRTTLNFSVTSPFSRDRQSFTELNTPDFYQLQQSFSQIRRFTISFNYRFAKVQNESIKKNDKL